MIVALIIVALLGSVSCHGSRNYDPSSTNADYGNAQYANPSYGKSQYNNAQYSNAEFRNAQYQNANNGNAQYANPSNGNAQYSNAEFGNAQYANPSNGNAQYSNAEFGNAQYANPSNGNAPNGSTQSINAEFGDGPLPYSGINEVSADTIYFVNPNTFKNITVRAANGNCKNVDFDFGITAIQATIFLNGEWCSPGDNVEWSLTLDTKLKVFGIQLVNDKYHFNPKYSEIHRNLHVGFAKADIRVGVYNYCIKIIGEACYWAGKWRCGDIYEVPHCFKSQNFYSSYLRSNAVQFREGGDCPSRMRQIAALAHSEF